MQATFKDSLDHLKSRYRAMRTKRARTRMLDGLAGVYGCDRKYLIKLLNGRYRYSPPKGRGRSYGKREEDLLLALRAESGGLCAPYLKAALPKLLADHWGLAGAGARDPAAERGLLAMSASTIGRVFKRRPPPGPRRGNRRSGANRLRAAIPARPGASIEDGGVGVCQFDSVAMGGGLPEPFFYALDITDSETQWTEIGAAWDRGAEATRDAFAEMNARLPFRIRKLHPDNGGEFINGVFLGHIARCAGWIEVSRSRPYHKNDNCRVEQKNGSVVRLFFRDFRIGDRRVESRLKELCRKISLYTDLFVPSKKLTGKTDRPGKSGGVVYHYDAPQTPLARLAKADPLNPNLPGLWELYRKTNQIDFLRKIKGEVRSIVRACRKSSEGGPGTRLDTASPGPSLGVIANEQRAPAPQRQKSLFGVISI